MRMAGLHLAAHGLRLPIRLVEDHCDEKDKSSFPIVRKELHGGCDSPHIRITLSMLPSQLAARHRARIHHVIPNADRYNIRTDFHCLSMERSSNPSRFLQICQQQFHDAWLRSRFCGLDVEEFTDAWHGWVLSWAQLQARCGYHVVHEPTEDLIVFFSHFPLKRYRRCVIVGSDAAITASPSCS